MQDPPATPPVTQSPPEAAAPLRQEEPVASVPVRQFCPAGEPPVLHSADKVAASALAGPKSFFQGWATGRLTPLSRLLAGILPAL
ncbi:MAG: hypothetical protein V3V52_12765 [Candidatus Adiutricales bacterium]